MGEAELHAHLNEGVEQQVEKSTLRVLMGFWLGIAIAAAGFWSSTGFAGG